MHAGQREHAPHLPAFAAAAHRLLPPLQLLPHLCRALVGRLQALQHPQLAALGSQQCGQAEALVQQTKVLALRGRQHALLQRSRLRSGALHAVQPRVPLLDVRLAGAADHKGVVRGGGRGGRRRVGGGLRLGGLGPRHAGAAAGAAHATC